MRIPLSVVEAGEEVVTRIRTEDLAREETPAKGRRLEPRAWTGTHLADARQFFFFGGGGDSLVVK